MNKGTSTSTSPNPSKVIHSIVGGGPARPKDGHDPTLTFSEFAVDTTITNQYESDGILFAGDSEDSNVAPYISDDGSDPTSPSLSGGEGFGSDLVAEFVVPGTTDPATVDGFSVDVGYINTPGSTQVDVFGPGGQLVGSTSVDATGIVEVTSNYADVASFLVTGSDPAGWEIDNLSYTAGTTPTKVPKAIAGGASSVHSSSCTHSATKGDPVDCASGDFYHTFTDASIPGYGPALDLTRTYNSLDASTEGIFGYGWFSSYESNLTFNEDGSITVTEGDGSQVTATADGSDYTVPSWADSTLVANEDGTYTFVRQGTQTFTYSSSGQLTSIADANGATTTLAYSSGKLHTVTDPSGRVLTFAYGDNGLVSSVTDPMSRETTYAYDGSDNLTSVTDPMSHVTSFTYDTGDSAHLLLTLTLPNEQSGGPDSGTTYTNTYNSSGQILTQTDALGHETTYAYSGDNSSSSGGTTTITDPDGNVEVESYMDGQLQTVVRGSNTWTYAFDQNTLGESSSVDPDGNVTSSDYDGDGNLIAQTDAMNNTTTYAYNAFNEQTCAAKPLAAEPCSSLSPPAAITAGTATITPPSSAPPAYVTYTEYDTDGNQIYQTTGDYAPGSDTASQSRTTYDLYNGQSVTLGSNDDSCTTAAPSTELPCATIDANGVVTQLAYDSQGDLTSKSTPDGNDAASPGTLSTFSGAPYGPVSANDVSQSPVQVATAVVGGTSYAYVTNTQSSVINRINLATDAETTVAGDYMWRDGGDGGPATAAEMEAPGGVAADSAGDVVISDSGTNSVRFVPAASGTYFGQSMTAGDIYTIAGNGTAGDTGDGGAGPSAELSAPGSVAMNAEGVAIADTANNVIRFVAQTSGTYFGQSMTAGDIYTIAGNGTAGDSGDAGAATSAELNAPGGVAFDAAGDVAIADSTNNVVRFVPVTSATFFGTSMTAEDIYTVAGNGTAGYSGDAGAATSAELDAPGGVAFDSSGDLAIADTDNSAVRFVPITSATFYGTSMTADDIYTIAGDGSWGNSGSGVVATSAEMAFTGGVAFDANGDVVVADLYNDEDRIVAATSGTLAGGSVTADDIYDLAGTDQWSDAVYSGPPSGAELDGPGGVGTDATGDVVIADTGTATIRFVPAASGTYFGVAMTAHDIYTVAGNSTAGYSGDGGAATSAELDAPGGAELDAHGDIVIADTTNNVVRFMPATSGSYYGQSMSAGDIYTIAGNGTAGSSGDGGAATSAELDAPGAVAVDAHGDIVIADTTNDVVRFVPKTTGTYYGQSMTADDIYTIAGDGTSGYSGDGAAASSAELSAINAVSLDAAGDLVIPDSYNAAVRFVPVTGGTYYGVAMTANDIYTIAGDGTGGYSGDGGPATSAELTDYLGDAAVDAAGNLLIADTDNDVVRFVPATSGTYYGQAMTADDIYRIAGTGWGDNYTTGDGGAPLDGSFGWIVSIAPDNAGGFYLADGATNRVRQVSVGDTSGPDATTTYTYNDDGDQTAVTAPDGNISGANAANYTTTSTYNDDGEVTVSTQGGGDGATVTARTTDYGYDADGNRTSVTDPRGYETTTAYNADDEATLVTDPDSDATLTCYDGDQNVAETVPPVGVAANSLSASSCPTSYPSDYGDRLASDATTTAYDALGNKTTVTTPAPSGLSGHETTTYSYDAAGRLTLVTAPPTSNSDEAPDSLTNYIYYPNGELLAVVTGQGSATAATTSYCYDPNGNKTASVAPDGNTSSIANCSVSSAPYDTSSSYQTTYSYDSLGELVTQTAPATSVAPSGQVTSYTYDPDGNQLTSENPDDVTATDTYTPLDQAASVSYSDSTPGDTYSYDADGNRTAMTDGSGTTTSGYDPFDELTSSTDGAGATTSYSYDLDGNVNGITYPLGADATWASSDTVSYGYDHADELTSVTDFNGHESDVTNTADDVPSALTLGASGDTVTTDYAADDGTSSITLGDGSTLEKFAYSDVPSGGIASETDTPSSALSPADYSYDAQSRVTEMTPGTDTSLTYGEDASSNLTTLPTGATGTYDEASELTSSVLSGTTTDYTYDAAGNRTEASVGGTATVNAAYNGAAQLTNYENAAANMTADTYDGDGLRTSATATPVGGSSSTQSFVWNTLPSVPQLLMDSENAYIYGASGTPFEQVNLSSGLITYLVSDALGSVRGAVTSTGTLTASTSYDAWGNPETTGGLSAYTPFGFAGGYTDPTGLIYLIGRYYDPGTGQFLTVDPLVDVTGQPYAYVGDDPVNGIDPIGLSPWGWVASTATKTWNDTGGKVVHAIATHPLQTVEIIGAAIATVATDGATSELLAEEISVTVAEDGSVELSTSEIYLDTASDTSRVGELAGGVGTAAGIGATVQACLEHSDLNCAISAVTSAVGLASEASQLADITKVLIADGVSLADIRAFISSSPAKIC